MLAVSVASFLRLHEVLPKGASRLRTRRHRGRHLRLRNLGITFKGSSCVESSMRSCCILHGRGQLPQTTRAEISKPEMPNLSIRNPLAHAKDAGYVRWEAGWSETKKMLWQHL